MIISRHAAQRFCERINPALSIDQACAEIMVVERAIDEAARFGCPVVRHRCGAKLVLEGDTVVTVLPRRWIAQSSRRAFG